MMRFPLRDFDSFDVVAVRPGPFSRRSSHKQRQQQQRELSRVQRWHTGAVFVVVRCISCPVSLSTARDDDDEHRNSDEYRSGLESSVGE